jgi:hypothetical protein
VRPPPGLLARSPCQQSLGMSGHNVNNLLH